MIRSSIGLTSGIALLGFTGSAIAADMPIKARPAPVPAPVVYSWTGLYVGVDGGWARANYTHDFNISGHYNFDAGDTFDYSHSGGIVSGHIGYNWQVNQLVIGIEGSIAKPWVSANDAISPFFPDTDRWSSKVNWIATVTPRLGFAATNFLIYGKGGWAYANAKDFVQDGNDFVDSGNLSLSGWTVGGGVEYMFTPNWIFGVEYNHYDFGKKNITQVSTNFSGGTFFPGTDHDFGVVIDSVVARLSYKFW